jgi:DnaJ-class molecular chaperone
MLRDGMCNACHGPQGAEHRDETSPPHQRDRPSSIDLRTAYRILGCDETASPEEIRNLRRALVKECHSDRLPPEASRECVESANTRFREIQEAYEAVMESLKKPT